MVGLYSNIQPGMTNPAFGIMDYPNGVGPGMQLVKTGKAGGGLNNVAQFVGAFATTSSGFVQVIKPPSTSIGDYMIIFCPYQASAPSGGDGNWNHSQFNWPSYGYDSHVYHKQLTANDIAAASFGVSVAYGPVTAVVYRGPSTATVVSTVPSANGSNLTFLNVQPRSNNSYGMVGWTSDRDGSGECTAPTGWTERTANNDTGVFTGKVADLLGYAALSDLYSSPTWTNFTNGFDQVGFMLELRGPETITMPAFWMDNLGNGFAVSASNEPYGQAYQAFDQNPTSIWGCSPSAGYLQIQFPIPAQITNYYIRNQFNQTTLTPTQWDFQGSVDGSTWNTLDSEGNQQFASGAENAYTVGRPGNYRYYRLSIATNSNSPGVSQIAGLRFTFAPQ